MRSNTEGWSNTQLNDRIEELEDMMEDWDSRWKYVGEQLYRAMERAVIAEEKLEAVKAHMKKWRSHPSAYEDGSMSDWKNELDEILEGED